MKKIILICVILIPAALAWGQRGYNAKAMSVAGAFQGMANGAEVTSWNPANLAMPGNPRMTIDFLNFGMSMGNNRYNVSLYNDLFGKGYFETHDVWDDAAKEAIVGDVGRGIRLFNRMHFTTLAVSYNKYAVAVNHSRLF